MASTRATWRSSTVGPGYFFSQLAFKFNSLLLLAWLWLSFGGGWDKGLHY
jgi:hypothetical protein